jgi:hypothetical protein
MSLGIYNGANSNLPVGVYTGTDIGTAGGIQSNGDYELKLVPSTLVMNYDASNRVSHFGDANTRIWNDLSGGNNVATITSNLGYSSLYNGGVTFPGASPGGVNTDPSTAANFQENFTAQVTAMVTSFATNRTLLCGFLQGALQIRTTTGGAIQLVRSLLQNIGNTAGGVIILNRPFIVAVTKTQTATSSWSYTIFINGVAVTTATHATNLASTSPMLGRNGNGINNSIQEILLGSIYSFQFYNRVLTPSEIYRNYLVLRQRFRPTFLI